MAVVSISKHGDLTGSERQGRLVQPYVVVVDDPATTLNEIFAHPSLPVQGASHPEIGWLFVFDRRPAFTQDMEEVRIVEVEYAQIVLDNDLLDKVLATSNPLTLEFPELNPPTKQWRTSETIVPERFHRCSTRDGELRDSAGTVVASIASGKLLTNTALIPPVDPPMRRSFGRVFNLTRFENFWTDSLSDPYLGRTNATTWKGKARGTVLCTKMDASNKYVRTMGTLRELVVVEYEFEYTPLGHWEDHPNVGVTKFNGSSHVAILDDEENPISDPVPLDEAGEPIDPADLPDDELHIRQYKYEEGEFNNLQLN